jgi:hypothetical protein
MQEFFDTYAIRVNCSGENEEALSPDFPRGKSKIEEIQRLMGINSAKQNIRSPGLPATIRGR